MVRHNYCHYSSDCSWLSFYLYNLHNYYFRRTSKCDHLFIVILGYIIVFNYHKLAKKVINEENVDFKLSNVAGKRSCLGEPLARQQTFLFLVSLLQNFHFEPPEGQDSIDVHEVWGMTNMPSDYEVRMIARDP